MKTAIITIVKDGKTTLWKESEIPYAEAKEAFNKLCVTPPKGAESIVLWPSDASKSMDFDEKGRVAKFFKKIDPKDAAAAAVDALKKGK